MSPVSDPQTHSLNSVDQHGLPHQERVRPKNRSQTIDLRVETLNIGTMTGKGRATAELMRTQVVDILCVQDTRWTRDRAKELGDGCKIIYSGASKE